jgi:hypothetical protein
MLLTSLKKHTPSYHVDYENIEKALQSLQQITLLVNEKKRDLDNVIIFFNKKETNLSNLSKMISSKDVSLENKKLILFNQMKVTITTIDTVKNQTEKQVLSLWCFLFNNLILFCKDSDKKKRSTKTKEKPGLLHNSENNFDHILYYTHLEFLEHSNEELENFDASSSFTNIAKKISNSWGAKKDKISVLEIFDEATKMDKILIILKNEKLTKYFLINEFIIYQTNFDQKQIQEKQGNIILNIRFLFFFLE